jgi:hypothetical protein
MRMVALRVNPSFDPVGSGGWLNQVSRVAWAGM